jgi:hypothetical protein
VPENSTQIPAQSRYQLQHDGTLGVIIAALARDIAARFARSTPWSTHFSPARLVGGGSSPVRKPAAFFAWQP